MSKKRSFADIRDEMLANGAHLISLKRPDGVSDAEWKAWEKVEKYGLMVTAHGCLIPYRYFCRTSGKSHSFKGHQRSAAVFVGSAPASNGDGRDELGWPSELQLSHICHRSACCNPSHILIEEQWRNLKRNFCGREGVCDCGSQPACLLRYQSSKTPVTDPILDDEEEARAALTLALANSHHSFVIRPRNYYRVEDEKSRNRITRLRRKRKHDAQAAKNAERRAGAQTPIATTSMADASASDELVSESRKRRKNRKSTKLSRKKAKEKHFESSGR